MIDSHSHLNDEKLFLKTDIIIKNSINAGIKFIMVPGYNFNSSKRGVFLAKKYNIVFSSVGIHPNYITNYNKIEEKKLIKLSKNSSVKAIGEIGLDYHYENCNKKKQIEIFINQLKIAKILKKPVIIHSRDSSYDTLNILLKYGRELKGVIHCFSYSKEIALEFIKKLNFYISLSGIVTFDKAFSIKKIAKEIPLSHLLIETDAPYISPNPYRGKLNEPKYLYHILKKISEIRNESIKKIEKITEINTLKLFNF